MKILVTGGTGVVGTGTVTELLRRGHGVVLFARHAADDARQWPAGVEARVGDVADAASVRGAADGCDAVLHMAGIVDESPPEVTFERVNVQGTANLLAEAARAGASRVVFVSSLGADDGESGYHQSKQRAETLVRGSATQWTICRPGNVYGPGDQQISTMLRLVRGPTPIVPKIGSGDQPFQPIWWEDIAKALATVIERADLAGRELDIAGPEVSCQNDILSRLSAITGRDVKTIPVPALLATLGAKAVSLVGWKIDFNEQELTMLREGNVLREGEPSALTDILGVTPTPLDEGLRMLADLQPEQHPSDGVGSLERKRYWADIRGCQHTPAALFAIFREKFNEVTPVFVEACPEPSASDRIDEAETITLALPMRGHVQVRVAELGENRATLLTLEGHPLAGAVRFSCAPNAEAIRFQVEVFDRPANLIDLVAMRSLGDRLQDHTWSEVVDRMIARSGGRAEGVRREARTLDDAEAEEIEAWLGEVAMRQKRRENAEKIATPGS